MILIADSGSTKTDWRMIDSTGATQQARTSGINPYFQSREEIIQVLEKELDPQFRSEIQEVYFYGAGCSSVGNKNKVKEAFRQVFREGDIYIEHDLLAAARSTCNRDEGIACILGTGSNSCVYDGQKIIENVPSLGFILGDEGSGAYLGKKLIKDFLTQKLPKNLQEKFNQRFPLSREHILQKVYQEPYPNRYLAGFTQFLFHHLKDSYAYQLVYHGFEEFIKTNVFRYPHYETYRVHFVGSVAFYFSNILRQVTNDLRITIGNVVETPIAGLTLFHQNE